MNILDYFFDPGKAQREAAEAAAQAQASSNAEYLKYLREAAAQSNQFNLLGLNFEREMQNRALQAAQANQQDILNAQRAQLGATTASNLVQSQLGLDNALAMLYAQQRENLPQRTAQLSALQALPYYMNMIGLPSYAIPTTLEQANPLALQRDLTAQYTGTMNRLSPMLADLLPQSSYNPQAIPTLEQIAAGAGLDWAKIQNGGATTDQAQAGAATPTATSGAAGVYTTPVGGGAYTPTGVAPGTWGWKNTRTGEFYAGDSPPPGAVTGGPGGAQGWSRVQYTPPPQPATTQPTTTQAATQPSTRPFSGANPPGFQGYGNMKAPPAQTAVPAATTATAPTTSTIRDAGTSRAAPNAAPYTQIDPSAVVSSTALTPMTPQAGWMQMSPGYQLQLDEFNKNLNNQLAARGRADSSIALQQQRRGQQELTAREYEAQLSRLANLVNMGMGGGMSSVGSQAPQVGSIAAGQPSLAGAYNNLGSMYQGIGSSLGQGLIGYGQNLAQNAQNYGATAMSGQNAVNSLYAQAAAAPQGGLSSLVSTLGPLAVAGKNFGWWGA